MAKEDSVAITVKDVKSVVAKNGMEIVRDRAIEDSPELYNQWKATITKALEPQYNDKGEIVRMPSVKVMELVARVLGLDSAGGGVTINQQFNQNNTTVANKSTLEDLIRRSEAREKEVIIDAEIIEPR